MWEKMLELCPHILEWLELLYYIAFIVLTALLVWYTAKSYILQSRKEFQILCKLCVISDIPGGAAKGFGVEIYNHGNIVKEKVAVYYCNEYCATIDYIKPNESIVIPLGSIIELPGGMNILIRGTESINASTKPEILIEIDGVKKEYSVNADILYSYHGGVTALNDIAKTLGNIEKKVGNLATKR